MEVKIRKATEKDFAAIFSLIRELAIFENGLDKVTNSVELMKEEKDFFKCLVAENKTGEIVGIALYFFAYYTWVGKSLYLDDLVIKKAFRRNGIGTKLMEKVFDIAREENCKRLRLQVLHWNTPAIELYKKNGFLVDKEWYNCDFNF